VASNEVVVCEREREREERKRQERGEEEVMRRFKLAPITLDWLTRLSCAACSSTTSGHTMQGG
jgi:hypothetical protein